MDVIGIRTEGLGDTTYVLAHGGSALVVDPQRDIGRFLDVLDETAAEPRFVMETHVHNDYLSGAPELSRRTGAELVLPAAAGAAFRHTPAFHQEPLDGGAFAVVPLHTPGHTPEHTSYVVTIDGRPVAIFSGGSLLVGSAGRTDLLGERRAGQLARLQYRSVRRLADYPDEVELLPTHGAGSFCTSSTAGEASSTIGRERRENPVLAYPDADAFVEGELSGLGPYPSYYREMAGINLAGAPPSPVTEVPSLTIDEARSTRARIVDIRPRHAYAAGHLPDSLGVELGDSFAVWVGWLVPHGEPLALVADADQDITEAVTQLGRIGFDQVVGVVTHPAPGETDAFEMVTAHALAQAIVEGRARQILDVREPPERLGASIDGAYALHVAEVVAAPPHLDRSEPVWVVCGSGFRSTIAGGALQQAGYTPVVVSEGGVPDVLAALAELDER